MKFIILKAEKFDPKQLEIGAEIELEHTSDRKVAEEIAKDHLREFPDYYIRLKRMEAEAKLYWSKK